MADDFKMFQVLTEAHKPLIRMEGIFAKKGARWETVVHTYSQEMSDTDVASMCEAIDLY